MYKNMFKQIYTPINTCFYIIIYLHSHSIECLANVCRGFYFVFRSLFFEVLSWMRSRI